MYLSNTYKFWKYPLDLPDFKPNPEFNIPKKSEEPEPLSKTESKKATTSFEKNTIEETKEANISNFKITIMLYLVCK